MGVYNLEFDESWKRILQARRKNLSNDHTLPTHIEERVIVPDLRRRPISMIKASKAYAEATSSMVKFLIAENDLMEKDFSRSACKHLKFSKTLMLLSCTCRSEQ